MLIPVISDILVDPSLKIDQFHKGHHFFMTSDKVVYRIESKSNQKVPAPSESKVESKTNRFDSPG